MPKPSTSSLATYTSQDIFLYVPQALPEQVYVLFFIPGNPGLISYYNTFLSLLSKHPQTSICIIAGFSLGGFDLCPWTTVPEGLRPVSYPPDTGPANPDRGYTLEEQIHLTYARIRSLCGVLNNGLQPSMRPRIILIGHSVGAYIALECIQHHASRNPERAPGENRPSCDITGAILLTPTIMDIAKSDSGRILTALVTYIPRFALLVSKLIQLFVNLFSEDAMRMVVRWITGMAADSPALEATVCFLKGDRCVRQSLEMAADEMRVIKDDKWGSDVWGDATQAAAGHGLKMVFYFVEKDHWVADSTREEITRTRGRVEDGEEGAKWKPEVVVEKQDAVVHGWCIRHNGLVAKRVSGWIDAMVQDPTRHRS